MYSVYKPSLNHQFIIFVITLLTTCISLLQSQNDIAFEERFQSHKTRHLQRASFKQNSSSVLRGYFNGWMWFHFVTPFLFWLIYLLPNLVQVSDFIKSWWNSYISMLIIPRGFFQNRNGIKSKKSCRHQTFAVLLYSMHLLKLNETR